MLTDEELQQLTVKANQALSSLREIFTPPPPNYRLSFSGDTSTSLQFYIKHPPNKLQRWVTWKVFGIKGEIL